MHSPISCFAIIFESCCLCTLYFAIMGKLATVDIDGRRALAVLLFLFIYKFTVMLLTGLVRICHSSDDLLGFVGSVSWWKLFWLKLILILIDTLICLVRE